MNTTADALLPDSCPAGLNCRLGRDALEILRLQDLPLLEHCGAERGDRDRRVLQAFLAAARGDHDVASVGGVNGLCRRFLRDRKRGDQARGQRKGAAESRQTHPKTAHVIPPLMSRHHFRGIRVAPLRRCRQNLPFAILWSTLLLQITDRCDIFAV